jgi:hypothetical protein
MGRGNSCSGKSDRISTGCGDHPNSFLVFVALEKWRFNGIGDPTAIGAQLRVMHLVYLEIVIDGDGTLGCSK